ncbi:MAG: AraC family transcriptional regulator [Clostridia bacterium]|nr:AraC family transcriptional regulator [Clostridia bacterium]
MYIHFAPNPNDLFFSWHPDNINHPFVYVNTFIDASNNIEIKRNFIRLIEGYDSGDTVRQTAHLNIILNDLSKNRMYEDSAYVLAIKIQKMINDAIPNKLTNEEIAKKLNVSIRTAETTFKKCFGMSIHQYLIYRRVELAKFWLKFFPEQKMSVTATGLGFFDEYHFSRQFKTVTGMSPTEYKNMYISK